MNKLLNLSKGMIFCCNIFLKPSSDVSFQRNPEIIKTIIKIKLNDNKCVSLKYQLIRYKNLNQYIFGLLLDCQ